jgi:UTP-glucose-1-phosphate uridylyltransferase
VNNNSNDRELTFQTLLARILKEETRLKGTFIANETKTNIQALVVKNQIKKYKFQGKCFNCGKRGHRSKDCRMKKRKEKTKNRDQGDKKGSYYKRKYKFKEKSNGKF